MLQQTIKEKISLEGIGLFTGERVLLRMYPAPEDTGIVFKKILQSETFFIPAGLDNVVSTNLCTVLGSGKARIGMVEHLLSALFAMGIDNAIIEVEGNEILSGDGSANLFVEHIAKAGIEKQHSPKNRKILPHSEFYKDQEAVLFAIPDTAFKVSYTLHYPKSNLLRSQFYTFSLDQEAFMKEIAPARTFSVYEDIQHLLDGKGIKGGGLHNALIIQNDNVLNSEGMRFPEEMARHKILDIIGDLSLLKCFVPMHVIAVRSGHAANFAFAKKLSKIIQVE